MLKIKISYDWHVLERYNIDTTNWKTGKLAYHNCLEDTIWNFCQFSLLSDILRCRHRSIPLYCDNNSFKPCCKSKRSGLTLQQLAYFALKVLLILSRFWRVHIVFHRCKFWHPDRFHFNLNWKRVGKQWVVHSLTALDITMVLSQNKKKFNLQLLN